MEAVSDNAEVKLEVKPKPEELVSVSVLDEYKNDMFKYKSKMRENEAELQSLKNANALRDKEQLLEKEEWKVLYEKESTLRSQAQTELETKSNFFINSSKINSVVQKLGGFKKDSYSRFINTESIDMNDDGTFCEKSIVKEVDRMKQEYSELLTSHTAQKMPNVAPQNMQHLNQNLSGRGEISSAIRDLLKG